MIEASRTQTVYWSIQHLLIEYFTSNFSCGLSNPVPVYHVRHVALIARDHCGLSASGYLTIINKRVITFSDISLVEVR